MYSYTSTATGRMRPIVGANDPVAKAVTHEGNWVWCWKLDDWERVGNVYSAS